MKMKLYKNLVNAVALTVQEILVKQRHADKAIEFQFKKNPQWGSRDRRFVAEGVYDIVRHYRLYSQIANSQNNFWFITAVWLVLRNIEMPEWPEFKHINPAHILKEKELLKNNLPVFESYPDWLWQLAESELGKAPWEKEAVFMNTLAPVYLRANTLKTSLAGLAKALQAAAIETNTVEGCSSALRLSKRENIFQNKLFKDGWFEVQDAGSQKIGEFLNPQPGQMVVDACAGAGGKSLHLAALMNNKGRVISLDVEERKLEELRKRARRAGAFNVEARLIEGNKTISALEGKADKVLLDVPCSGLGVIRRNPDAKWKLKIETVEETKCTQSKILSSYSHMVKTGGTLVYSTCSILPSENRQQVDNFLKANPNFKLLQDKSILPSETGFDGFYMAALSRTA